MSADAPGEGTAGASTLAELSRKPAQHPPAQGTAKHQGRGRRSTGPLEPLLFGENPQDAT